MTRFRFQDADLHVLPMGIIVETPQRRPLADGRALREGIRFCSESRRDKSNGQIGSDTKSITVSFLPLVHRIVALVFSRSKSRVIGIARVL